MQLRGPSPILVGKCRMKTSLKAAALEVIHFTVDLDEASCGVALLCEDLAFSNSMLLNLPAPRPILAGYTAYSIKRCVAWNSRSFSLAKRGLGVAIRPGFMNASISQSLSLLTWASFLQGEGASGICNASDGCAIL